MIEPPCHDEEQLLLGFDTRSKTVIVAGYLLIPIVSFAIAPDISWSAFTSQIATSIAINWFFYTVAVILYRVLILIVKHGPYLSMIWFIKLIADPLTDIQAYYRSVLSPLKRQV